MEKYVENETVNLFLNIYFDKRSTAPFLDCLELIKMINETPTQDLLYLKQLLLDDLNRAKEKIINLESVLNDNYYTNMEKTLNIYKNIPLKTKEISNLNFFSKYFKDLNIPNNYYELISNLSKEVDLKDRELFLNRFHEFCYKEDYLNSLFGKGYKNVYPYPSSDVEIFNNYKNLVLFDKNYDNKSNIIGQYGEFLTVLYLTNLLRKFDYSDYEKRVIWASRDIGDGLGYDAHALTEKQEDLFVEAKARRIRNEECDCENDWFPTSKNEVIKMLDMDKKYVFRVFRVFIMPDYEPRFLFLNQDKTNPKRLIGSDDSSYILKYDNDKLYYEREKESPKLVFSKLRRYP